MADVRPRSYCIQYRETDLDFITRLLASEGLGWAMEEHAESVSGHRMVLFADSTQPDAFAEDATSRDSIAGQGIRYHNARAGEAQDTVQALAAAVSLGAASVTTLSYDYKAKKIVAASVPTNRQVGSMNAPQLESYDTPGLYAYAGADEAQRYARLQMEALEAASQRWQARSTVRTLRPGTRFSLTQGPLGGHTETAPVYNVLRVVSMGINNLPGPAVDGLAELFGPVPELLEECMERITGNAPADAGHRLTGSDAGALPGFGFADMIKQAKSTGYANRIDMMDATLPWRSAILDASGTMLLPRATAPGSQSAIVVGPDGQTNASGAEELYCDKLGRVRIRFHWQGDQDDANATCWVRVAQRSTGGRMGAQFLPRIGQEVLVTFLENNIDRPLILGALYNGQGEGGQFPTPGVRSDREADLAVFGHASDHAIAAQGNLAGGNSPHWHGASADSAGQRNSAAQSGMRSKEFGGNGYNQLLFNNTDQQGRTGLKSTQAATELTLGHMLHSADNFRGSFRGLGAELRSDAYGAVRAGAGLLLSTFGGTHGAQEREPAGDNAPALAHMKQAMLLAQTFSGSAVTHQAVALASQIGSSKVDASTIDPKAAPVKALYTAVAGMLAKDSASLALDDAAAKTTAPDESKLPHNTDAIIALSAKAGFGVIAGQDQQFSSGETTTFMTGQDSQMHSGGQLRAHSSQAVGLLGGVVTPGALGVGLHIIAAQQQIDVQAQSDVLGVQARDDIDVISANAHIDWAAAKSISLSTAGGANITISGGNIVVQCPGKITIKAGNKKFLGPVRQNFSMPVIPVSVIIPAKEHKLTSTFAFDQLTLVAKNFSRSEFVMLIAPVFGLDIPASVYIKLYDGLRAGTIAQPLTKLMTGGHYPAMFDNQTREILVHQAAAERAAKGNDDSWELLTALMHEFGHYIDLVLRSDLADKHPDGSSTLSLDAPEDEGAKFAYWIAFFDFSNEKKSDYAEYFSPKFNGPLTVDFRVARLAVREAQGEEAQRHEKKEGSLEFFGAGLGEHHNERPNESFGHQSIEAILSAVAPEFASTAIRKQIYFGNWLRDYSQLLDPALVRKVGAPKNFPRAISRKKLTALVDLFSELEFVNRPAEKKDYKVTEEILRVYRPVEHIDNPKNNDPAAPDPQSIDKDFQPRATRQDISVDPATSMKRYIRHSADFMADQLNRAVAAGPTGEGYRHFGAALHVLEDYFAHSNFVELSLRKLGHSRVLPWTSSAPGKHKLPVVTGMFDSDDVIASTAGLISDVIFKVEWNFSETKPGERTKADRILLILLSEHSDPRMLETFQYSLYLRDKIAGLPGHKYLQGAMHYTFGMVANVYNSVYGNLLHLVGNSVDDQQVLRVGDPNTNGSTDPTHSQLAKDHDNHPFHTLAAELAQEAVRNVGDAMAKRWWRNDLSANPALTATRYIAHPFDTTWQDGPVAKWAARHPRQVVRGESATEWEALEKAHKQEAIDAINNAGKRSKRIWDYINDNYQEIFSENNQVRK